MSQLSIDITKCKNLSLAFALGLCHEYVWEKRNSICHGISRHTAVLHQNYFV